MAIKCIVCGKLARNKGGNFKGGNLIDDKFCSKPCSKKVKRMCKRVGCTETWYATVNNGQKYCSRDCTPQSSSGPKYPYRLNRQCTHCAERFSVEINDESDRLNEPICNECDAVLNSRDWKCMRLITEKGYRISDLKNLDDASIDFFYEECERELEKSYYESTGNKLSPNYYYSEEVTELLNNSVHSPTAKQVRYLRKLGWKGEVPSKQFANKKIREYLKKEEKLKKEFDPNEYTFPEAKNNVVSVNVIKGIWFGHQSTPNSWSKPKWRPRYSAKMQKYLNGLTDAERRKFLGEEE